MLPHARHCSFDPLRPCYSQSLLSRAGQKCCIPGKPTRRHRSLCPAPCFFSWLCVCWVHMNAMELCTYECQMTQCADDFALYSIVSSRAACRKGHATLSPFFALHSQSGTTAVVALCRDDCIWVANAGDSRAVLGTEERDASGERSGIDMRPSRLVFTPLWTLPVSCSFLLDSYRTVLSVKNMERQLVRPIPDGNLSSCCRVCCLCEGHVLWEGLSLMPEKLPADFFHFR